MLCYSMVIHIVITILIYTVCMMIHSAKNIPR